MLPIAWICCCAAKVKHARRTSVSSFMMKTIPFFEARRITLLAIDATRAVGDFWAVLSVATKSRKGGAEPTVKND